MAGIATDSKNQQQNRFALELTPRLGLTYARANVHFAPVAVVPLDKSRKKE
jgi:hypothetical protein